MAISSFTATGWSSPTRVLPDTESLGLYDYSPNKFFEMFPDPADFCIGVVTGPYPTSVLASPAKVSESLGTRIDKEQSLNDDKKTTLL